MNAVEIYRKAESDIEHDRITLGEFDDRIKPLMDVEQVVRCKDCKYAEVFPMWVICRNNITRGLDWYCADGCRKDGDGE